MDSTIIKLIETSVQAGAVILFFHWRISGLESRVGKIADRLSQCLPECQQRWRNGAVTLLVLSFILASSGCARYSVTMRETDASGVTRETRSRVMCIGDTKSAVEKLKIDHGKSQSLGVEGFDSYTSATNAASGLKDLVRLAEILSKP